MSTHVASVNGSLLRRSYRRRPVASIFLPHEAVRTTHLQHLAASVEQCLLEACSPAVPLVPRLRLRLLAFGRATRAEVLLSPLAGARALAAKAVAPLAGPSILAARPAHAVGAKRAASDLQGASRESLWTLVLGSHAAQDQQGRILT